MERATFAGGLREGDLTERQRELTHSIDCFDVGVVQKNTISRIEHALSET
jgi:hypothetical protein